MKKIGLNFFIEFHAFHRFCFKSDVFFPVSSSMAPMGKDWLHWQGVLYAVIIPDPPSLEDRQLYFSTVPSAIPEFLL